MGCYAHLARFEEFLAPEIYREGVGHHRRLCYQTLPLPQSKLDRSGARKSLTAAAPWSARGGVNGNYLTNPVI
jgi:hypothetical protein